LRDDVSNMVIGLAKILVRSAWQHPVFPENAGSKSGAGAEVTERISLLSARLLVKGTYILATGVNGCAVTWLFS